MVDDDDKSKSDDDLEEVVGAVAFFAALTIAGIGGILGGGYGFVVGFSIPCLVVMIGVLLNRILPEKKTTEQALNAPEADDQKVPPAAAD